MRRIVIENSYKIFDYFFRVMTERLDIGYAVGLGFCSIVNKQKENEEIFILKKNHVRCLLRFELLNDATKPDFIKDLTKQELNKLIEVYTDKMEHVTVATDAVTKCPESFREVERSKIQALK